MTTIFSLQLLLHLALSLLPALTSNRQLSSSGKKSYALLTPNFVRNTVLTIYFQFCARLTIQRQNSISRARMNLKRVQLYEFLYGENKHEINHSIFFIDNNIRYFLIKPYQESHACGTWAVRACSFQSHSLYEPLSKILQRFANLLGFVDF